MGTITLNISFPKQLIKTMDRLAREEARSRSELLREAVRMYVERKRRWRQIFSFWREEARRARLGPEDIGTLVTEVRGRNHAS